MEIDLVAHCGDSNYGEFISSLNATDIATGWTETRAIIGKGQRGVVAALDEIRQILPFTLIAIDSDSGSEFISMHLVRWCQAHNIYFTRSRPYKKNDNAHIEQKNWTQVRRLLGWSRFESQETADLMNALYSSELRIWMNCFQPSVKLVTKERHGSRVCKRYDFPQTPINRLTNADLAALADTDPFELAEAIQRRISQIAQRAAANPASPGQR
ncbi:MAG: transposase family protein [Candidatus Eremiobacteraeota bacterium]|nr:transposase family protein [Candidatus Eremiobacteraeota bacterium]